MKTVLNVICAFAATITVAGCTDYESETDLNPAGPPMIQQVRFKETYVTNVMTGATSERFVFGFGNHPMATEMDAHPVASATAQGNPFRVIMDELLVGNNLEEIACRGQVDSDVFARVPRGATPDDIARCSAAQDVLPSTCAGEFAVCVCENDAGCAVPNVLEPIAKGKPVGVVDINQDGAADESRLIDGSVGLQCGAIAVPLDLDSSYWNPSGNQQVPAMGGFGALGPAIVLLPTRGLPTNIECQLQFSGEVVDKQGIAPCTPPNGDVNANCTAGDVSGFKFKVEPLRFETDTPSVATGVNRMTNVTVIANSLLDLTSVTMANVRVETVPPGGPVPTYTFTVMTGKTVNLTFATPLAATTQYRVTFTTGVKDGFGQPLPSAHVVTFTTAN